MFARTDRLPAWLAPGQRADVYPVEVRRDPPQIAAVRRRVELDIAAAAGTRCSTFRSKESLPGRRARSPTKTSRANGSTASSASPSISTWARDHYFNDILKQVAQIGGNAGPTSFAVDR